MCEPKTPIWRSEHSTLVDLKTSTVEFDRTVQHGALYGGLTYV